MLVSVQEADQKSLLVNFMHYGKNKFHKWMSYTAISAIKKRALADNELQNVSVVDCRQGRCQKKYADLVPEISYQIKTKPCAHFEELSVCSSEVHK